MCLDLSPKKENEAGLMILVRKRPKRTITSDGSQMSSTYRKTEFEQNTK